MFVTQSQGQVSMVRCRKLQKYVACTIGLKNPRVAIHQHKNGENNVAFPIACKPSRVIMNGTQVRPCLGHISPQATEGSWMLPAASFFS